MSKRPWIHAFLLSIFLVGPVQAQDGATLVQVLTVSVKPGKDTQFEQAVRMFRDASRKQGMQNYWLSAQSVSGAPVYRFHVNRSGWGTLSNPGPNLVQALGAEEAARLAALLHESIESEHVAFFNEIASASHVPATAMATPPQGLIYIDFTLNPGTASQFLEMVNAQKIASSTMYPNNYFGVSMPNFGADGPRTILILNSFGDLDRQTMGVAQRLTEHFGQTEGARLNQLAQQSIAGFEATLFRTRSDLNYQPE